MAGRETRKRKEGHERVREVGWSRRRGGWLGGRQGRERKVTEESRRWAGVGEEEGVGREKKIMEESEKWARV